MANQGDGSSGTYLWHYVIVVAGTLLVVGAFFPSVFRDPETGATVLGNPFRFVLTVGPGALIIASTVQLHRLDIDTDLYSRVAGWTVGGISGLAGVILLIGAMNHYSTGSADISAFGFQIAGGIGAVSGLLVGINEGRSITRTREAERQRAAAVIAEESRENLAFLNNLLRHHVLNGLQIVRGNAQLLHEEHEPERVDRIIERSDAVIDLVQNVSRLVEADASDLPVEHVDLSAMLRNEADALSQTHPEAEIELNAPDGLDVAADRLVSAVFENLLRNAIEHNVSETPRVSLTAETTPEAVRVLVADNGPGIDDVSEAFAPGESGANGIGLHLVDTLVDRYGGDLSVETDTSGTTIEVTLPASARTAAMESPITAD